MSKDTDNAFEKAEEAEKFPKLNKEQVDYVLRMIDEDIHPIQGSPLYKVFPWLCCFCNWPRKDLGKDILSAVDNSAIPLLKRDKRKKGSKKFKDEDAVKNNPLLSYGFGMNIYIKMMYSLGIMFVVFSILVFPIMKFFSEGTAYDSVREPSWEIYSLGNLGYS
jgi:hypothetical protein